MNALRVCSAPEWRTTCILLTIALCALLICIVLVWATLHARAVVLAGLIMVLGAAVFVWFGTESATVTMMWLSELGGCR